MEWLIEGLLPKQSRGCVGVLLAPRRSGATTLLATMTRMAPRARFEFWGQDPASRMLVSRTTEYHDLAVRVIDGLALHRHPPVDCYIFDCQIIDSHGLPVDWNQYGEVEAGFEKLRALARQTSGTVVLVVQTNPRNKDRFFGPSWLRWMNDFALHLTSDKDGRLVTYSAKTGPSSTWRFQHDRLERVTPEVARPTMSESVHAQWVGRLPRKSAPDTLGDWLEACGNRWMINLHLQHLIQRAEGGRQSMTVKFAIDRTSDEGPARLRVDVEGEPSSSLVKELHQTRAERDALKDERDRLLREAEQLRAANDELRALCDQQHARLDAIGGGR